MNYQDASGVAIQAMREYCIRATICLALALGAATAVGKSLDPVLKQRIELATERTVHQVIITLTDQDGVSQQQLTELEAIGISGIHLTQLPIVAALANAQQIEQIYQRPDVVSIWHNARLTWEATAKIANGRAKLTEITENAHASVLDGYTGKGVGVLINDTGIDGSHADIQYPSRTVQNVIGMANLNSFSGILPVGYQEGVLNTDIAGGHGTHIAGIIGGNGALSKKQRLGVAPNANLIGYGHGADFTLIDALSGLDYALVNQQKYNIRIVFNAYGNCSDLGTDFNPDDPMNIASKRLADQGIILVFSAGNTHSTQTQLSGNFKKAPWVITVAATDQDGKLANFSALGKPLQQEVNDIDVTEYKWQGAATLAAPGVDIVSARASLSSLSALSVNQDSQKIPVEQLPFYTLMSGTSMAAAHVTGVIARMLEANPKLNWQQVKQILQSTAVQAKSNQSQLASPGLIDPNAAVQAALTSNTAAVFAKSWQSSTSKQ